LIVSATTVIGALGSSVGGQIAAIIGAVRGLGWGLLLGVMSNQLTRRGPTLSRRWLFFGSLVAATLLMRAHQRCARTLFLAARSQLRTDAVLWQT
jgi:hypothetical protein